MFVGQGFKPLDAAHKAGPGVPATLKAQVTDRMIREVLDLVPELAGSNP
ncbi:hypothetical protein BH23ACT12_BH23ACT12_23400 [soil metagenome]